MIEKLQDLNFLHLFYFWMVVRHRGITPACELLHLTQPTISTQIRKLERALGHKLFDRSGRELELTDVGKTVFEYADDMFGAGRELLGSLRGNPSDRMMRLMVGHLGKLRLPFYAITLQRKLTHSAVVAISQRARDELLALN